MRKIILDKVVKKINDDMLVEGKLGSTIKLKRKAGEHTLQEFSNSYGVSISYLSKIENDHMKPNISYIGNILDKLEINEEMFSSSLIMNDWYKKLILTIIGLESHYNELTQYITQRSDYQAKFIKFALDCYFNSKQTTEKQINNLLFNIDLLKPVELSIFVLSITKHYINNENYFSAGSFLRQIKESYLIADSLKVWYYELAFELAIYQSSYKQLKNTLKELVKYYFSFDLFDKIANARKKYIMANSYFLPPELHPIKEFNSLEKRSYECSLIYYKEYEDFLKVENKDSLAQLLFDDLHNNIAKVKKSLKTVVFSDDPLERCLKIYFEAKYLKNNYDEVFRKMFFAEGGLVEHYYCMEVIANKLSEHYKDQHKYKKCYLINKRLLELKNLNRINLTLKTI